jgi:hypothetical protein
MPAGVWVSVTVLCGGPSGDESRFAPKTAAAGLPLYNADLFEVTDFEHAREVILTPEIGRTPSERWERETPYLASFIAEHLKLDARSVLLDYGCGVGRLPKELIARRGTASGGIISNGGFEGVRSGGEVFNTKILFGGTVPEAASGPDCDLQRSLAKG